MMELAHRVMGSLFPVCSVLFLGLYVTGLASGVEPELALLRAGIAGTVLAAVARFAGWIMEEAAGSIEQGGLDASLGEPLVRPTERGGPHLASPTAVGEGRNEKS